MKQRLLFACSKRVSLRATLLLALAGSCLASPAGAQADVPAPSEPPSVNVGDDAEQPATERAKESFKAGAAAYAAGDYRAAIQALDAAYALTPLPPIAFSIAQAERRQYFVERRPEHLTRSVALFRRYLEEVPSGGRRADAIEALSQLEPLLAQAQPSAAPSAAPDRSTRILVSCDAPNARISVDGTEPGPSPLIREVLPGKHAVQASAPGFRDGKREIEAVPGELVPVTLTLAELPARLQLSTPDDAEIYVDGVLVSQGASPLQLELPSGRHRVSVAQKGHRVATQSLALQRGTTASASFPLEPTSQRIASRVLFVGGAAALVAGGAFSFLSLYYENQAQEFLARHERGNLSPAELVRYNQDATRRNFYRWFAGGSFAASLGLFVSGLFLHELDTPGPEDLYRSLPPQNNPLAARADQPRRRYDFGALVAPGQFGATLRGEF
jgi:hypothetical protein